MIWQVIGIVFIVAAFLHLLMKLPLWYSWDSDFTGGGTRPEIDGVIFPPLFLVFGLYVVDANSASIGIPQWAYLVIWLGGTVVTYLIWRMTVWIGSKHPPKL